MSQSKFKIFNKVYIFFRSPKTISAIKLGIAVIGAIRAFEDLKKISKNQRRSFEIDFDDEEI